MNFKITPNQCLKHFFSSLQINIFWSKCQKTLLRNLTIFSNTCCLYVIFSISTYFFSSNKANCLSNEWEPDIVFIYSKLYIILVYLWYTTGHVKQWVFFFILKFYSVCSLKEKKKKSKSKTNKKNLHKTNQINNSQQTRIRQSGKQIIIV